MKAIIYLSIFFLSLTSYGQGYNTRAREFFAMDVLTGGIIGGVGAAFHPKEHQTRGNAFLKGFAKGCVGGSLTFTGKYMTYGITKNENYLYAWPAKLVHAAGASIMENAARNAAIYDNWAIDYGAIRVDVNYKGKIRVRPQPFAAGGIILTALQGNRFNVKNTLELGTPYFTSNNIAANVTNSHVESGQTYINSVTIIPKAIIIGNFVYHKQDNIYNVSAHELIHVFQEREYYSMNNIYLNNKYKWAYIDLPAFDLVYTSLTNKNKPYYSNPFENQAETLSKRKFTN